MHEKTLAKRFEDVLRRRYCAIGKKPCQQQLSGDVLHFINAIPGVPLHGCSVNDASAGAIEADVPVVKRWERLAYLIATCYIMPQARLA